MSDKLAPLLLAALALAPAARAETVAFVGATIHPVSGPAIEGGVLVVEGDTLAAVGAGIPVPALARVIDVTGKHLYPAFLHPLSSLGLIEIGSVPGTDDTRELGDVNSASRAEIAFHPDSMLLPVTVAGGVLHAHVAPQGGLFAGTSALMRLAGWNRRDMTLAAPVGMHLEYPRMTVREGGFPPPPPPEEQEKERERLLEVLERTLADARAYARARQAAAGGTPVPEIDPALEALLPLVAGEQRLFVHAEDRKTLEHALDWAQREGFTDRLVLVAGPDAAYLAGRLAAAGIPVILNGVLGLPERPWEPYDATYTAAARLAAAGVRLALGDGGSRFGAANSRNLPFHAAMAAAFGLPREDALAAVTLRPAEILGVADRLGSLEAGKEATFLVTDGDPLEIRTRIERAFLAGRELDLTANRHQQLYRRYRGKSPLDPPFH